MMWSDMFAAIGLMLVFEGVLPFLSPNQWRQWLTQVISLDDRYLRIMGLVSMLLGVSIVFVTRHYFI